MTRRIHNPLALLAAGWSVGKALERWTDCMRHVHAGRFDLAGNAHDGVDTWAFVAESAALRAYDKPLMVYAHDVARRAL